MPKKAVDTRSKQMTIRLTPEQRQKLEDLTTPGETLTETIRRTLDGDIHPVLNNPESRGFDTSTGLHKDTGTLFDHDGFAADMRHETGSLFHPVTGLDWQGYDAFGFDAYGFARDAIHRTTSRIHCPEGFDADGQHKVSGTPYHPETGLDRDGYDKRGFHADTKQRRDGQFYDDEGVDAKGLARNGLTLQGFSKDGAGRWKNRTTEAIHDDDLYDHCGYLIESPSCDRTFHTAKGDRVAPPEPVGRKALEIESKVIVNTRGERIYKGQPAPPPPPHDQVNSLGLWMRVYTNRYGLSDDPYGNRPAYDRDGFIMNHPDKGVNARGFYKIGTHRNGTFYDDDGLDVNHADQSGYIPATGFDPETHLHHETMTPYDPAGFDIAGLHRDTGTLYDGNGLDRHGNKNARLDG